MNIQHAIRLIQEACALKHAALSTEKSNIYWIRHFGRFLQQPQRKPLLNAEAKIEGFLTHLALKGVSASTQNQAFNALLFLYQHVLDRKLEFIDGVERVRRPARVPASSAKPKHEPSWLISKVTIALWPIFFTAAVFGCWKLHAFASRTSIFPITESPF